MEFYNSAEKKKITQNNNIRYHYIEFSKDILLPPLVIDFKHYFTVSLGNLEEQLTNRIYSIDPLFRESISNRFAHYLSRIGLPDVFEKVKGFDEMVRVGEDIELVQRVVKKGGRFLFLKYPKIYTSVRRLEEEGRRKFAKKMFKAFFKVIRHGHQKNDVEYEFGKFGKE